MENQIIVNRINNSHLISIARTIDNQGILLANGNYHYLKISNDFIYKLFPLLENYSSIQIPDYFTPPHDIGAHITVIYPEEQIIITPEELNETYNFQVLDLAKAILGKKEYYVIFIASPKLEKLRESYNLPKFLNYQENKINFHITFAINKRTEV